MPTNHEGFTRTALEAAERNGDQSGKTFLVTGAYSGIGVETVKALLKVNGQVILAGRRPDLMTAFVAQLKDDGYDTALVDSEGPPLDLGDLATVQAFAAYVNQKYTKLDVLLLNAGVMMTPAGVTAQKLETQVGINVVGHFLLAHSLLTITARQVWVSSKAHEMSGAKRFDFEWFTKFSMDDEAKVKAYSPMFAYQQSKLGDILLAQEFVQRHADDDDKDGKKVEAVSLHPGVIDTNLARHLPSYIKGAFTVMSWVGILTKKTVEQGASTTVTCATLPSADLKNGAYYDDCQVGKASGNANHPEDAIRLYDLCLELTKDFQ